MKKKAQAAFEFLTTYGWAFLLMVVVAGALVYFTSDTTKQLPDSCILEGAPCEDFTIVGTPDVNNNNYYQALGILFQSQNPVFDKIEIQNFTCEYNNQELERLGCSPPDNFPVTVNSGGLIDIQCGYNLLVMGLNINIGETVNIKTKISYKIEGEVFTKYLTGEIISKVYNN